MVITSNYVGHLRDIVLKIEGSTVLVIQNTRQACPVPLTSRFVFSTPAVKGTHSSC